MLTNSTVLCWDMLQVSYYAQNYAGIIRQGLACTVTNARIVIAMTTVINRQCTLELNTKRKRR